MKIEILEQITCNDCGKSADIFNVRVSGYPHELCKECIDQRRDENEN